MKQEQRKADFVGLINEHRKMLRKICWVYGADGEDRQDLFQEIVVQLWKSYGTFAARAKFSTWLYRVALNTALYHLRRRTRRRLGREAQQELYRSGLRDDRLATDIRTLYRAIERLDKVDRAVVLLFLEQKSYQEMAEILDISVSHVSVRLVRAKEKLMKAFAACRSMEEEAT